ncbi:rhodanese homology domain-containing protein [Robbsia sp. Bb-Pol-6]|uniref:Rhodanese homology domain-containing protein n=1 Tax=Robbsia betulipollinis TaxID=2981849 RepID=A0ABT3ZLQ5_9BURK|nr:rhodanese homology domain-containing protein [Robbsia betulipollinis]MCY0387402.1 rhodanese homology domain-containing protein [Robbsia betulipollinis]
MSAVPLHPLRSTDDVRRALLDRQEIALLDVREEDPHAQGHPLFAANLALSTLELQVAARLPRQSVPIVVFDAGEGLAERAADRLAALGYRDVALLDGGLDGWARAGGEVFRDVNSPSKAFGELVESRRHTPSLTAEEVQALLERDANVVVLDARRYDEYQTMNIPGSISVPGAELVLRAQALAPDPATRVIVNCAGRTRSIIGTQSLVNAGLPNPVAALRNGTIGWTLAGQTLEHGSARHANPHTGRDGASLPQRAAAARALADRAGVRRAGLAETRAWAGDTTRTTYRFDVRTPAEYATAHVPGFLSAPGGQLVQETDMFAPVRGARVVLIDDDGVRANMTASWLAQMNVETHVVDAATSSDFSETGATSHAAPAGDIANACPSLSCTQLSGLLSDPASGTLVLDFTTSARYVARHIPGAYWLLRSRLAADLRELPDARRYVVTCGTSALARFVAPELAALTGKPVHVLEGGTAAWIAAGLRLAGTDVPAAPDAVSAAAPPVESPAATDGGLASPRIDHYRRPYEGTDNATEAMHAYLEWEYGLVAQLARDGTHGFTVL